MQDTSRHIEDLVSPQCVRFKRQTDGLPINGIFRAGEITAASDITRFRLKASSYSQVPPATANAKKRSARNEALVTRSEEHIQNTCQEITFEYQMVIDKVGPIREPAVFGRGPP
jgi:hypothetical protein